MTPRADEPQPDYRAAELLARVNRLELRVDDLDGMFPVPATVRRRSTVEDNPEALRTWVRDVFTSTFVRPLGGEYRWCSLWEEHPEAVERLRALRISQEVLQGESAMGAALWLRDHLDHHLGILLSSRGPFALCSTERHESLRNLAV